MLKAFLEFGLMKFNKDLQRSKIANLEATYYFLEKCFEGIMSNLKRCYLICVSSSVLSTTTCY